MSLLKRILFSCILLFSGGNALTQNISQDTILFLNGQTMISSVFDTSFFGVKVYGKTKKKKEMIVEGERIFSIKFASGKEKIYYKQDSVFENYFTVDETRLFIKGEQDAAKYKCRFSTISSFAVGAASGLVLGSVFAFIPPFTFSATTLLPKVRIRHSTVSNMNYLNYDTYILGYERVARKKRLINSLSGGVAGLAASFTGIIVYNKFIK